MKILFVSTSYPLYPDGASGIFVKRLVDAIGHRVTVQVAVPDGRKKSEPDASYPIHYFRYAPKQDQVLSHEPGGLPVAMKSSPLYALLFPGYVFLFFFSIFRHSAGFDLIHANWSLPGVLAGLVGKLRRIPVITTLRGNDVANLGSSFIRRVAIKLLLTTSSHVVSVSSEMNRTLLEFFPEYREKFRHIGNGVDESFFHTVQPEAQNCPLRLLCVGSLIERKQVAVAIEALAEAGVNARLTIAGDGPERSKLESLVNQLCQKENVEFLGSVPPEHVAVVLSQHDALILCSRSEGRPNVVIEAMASGKAVVSTRLPGVTELIEHNRNGLLFSVGDIDALAKNIKYLQKYPGKRRELGSAAKEKILRLGLTWDNCADKYCQLYEEALRMARGKD